MKRVRNRSLILQQMDERLSKAKNVISKRPTSGWISTLRSVLGISKSQMAKLLNMTPAAISRFERGELDNTISLGTLQKIAAVIDCDLTYAIVPRKTLRQTLQARALKVATQIISETQKHMALEDQGTSSAFRKERIRELANEFLRNSDKRIWEK